MKQEVGEWRDLGESGEESWDLEQRMEEGALKEDRPTVGIPQRTTE